MTAHQIIASQKGGRKIYMAITVYVHIIFAQSAHIQKQNITHTEENYS
jgi:hypothetical protein